MTELKKKKEKRKISCHCTEYSEVQKENARSTRYTNWPKVCGYLADNTHMCFLNISFQI